MSLAFKPEHLKRYRDIAQLMMKYGHSSMTAESGLDEILTEEDRRAEPVQDPKAEELADDLERMGPIYVKLGQVLSSRGDLLPAPYVKALTRLQDHNKPFSYAEVVETVEQELGCRLSKAFQEFEQKPLATASLGQVHRAILHNGRPVVVKVQRPGIRAEIGKDLEVLTDLARFADDHTDAGRRFQFLGVVDEFHKNLVRELDYLQEARNLARVGENLQEFSRIVVPQPVMAYSTSRVLTMDYIQGKKITSVGPLRKMELDGAALAEELFRAYLKQILVDGIFHADPHPGNVFITDDDRIALLDLGMVGHVSPPMQEHLLKLMIALSDGKGDEATDLAIKIGEKLEDFNEPAFRRKVVELVTQQQDAQVKDINIGRVMLDFAHISTENGIRTPSELTMLSKTLLNLDDIGSALDPEFNPNASIRRHAGEIMQQRVLKSLSLGNLVTTAMEAQELAREMPGRLNHILDMVAKNQLKVQVDAIDEANLIEGFQKVANRITTGLVLAALILGASLLMRVPSRFEILGYPGLAMLCFLGASGGGFWLLLTIMMSDRAVRHKPKMK
jgi:ubiquinone biosynthesis protein